MGCGSIFDIFGYGRQSRRGYDYEDRRYDYKRNSDRRYEEASYNDDLETKMTLLNRMYTEGTINDEEYLYYKERILNRTVSFEEIFNVKQARKNMKLNDIGERR